MPRKPTALSPVLPFALILAMAMEIAWHLTGAPPARWLLWGAVLAVPLAAWERLGLRETYLLSLCAILVALTLWRDPDPAAVVAGALDQAGFLMAFVLLLGLLHEAAGTSPSVAASGEYLTRQPPGRRYYALYLGTALLAVLFNLGVVSFLVPLVQRGIATAAPGDALNPIRERRQVSAMLRGFGWSVIWSPTAVAPLALMGLMPGVDRHVWLVWGALIFAGMMVLGALEDRIRFRAYRPVAGRIAPPFPLQAVFHFGLSCLWLFGMSGLVAWLAGDTIVFGLMVACPVMLVGWLLVQRGGIGPLARAATGSRLREIALQGLPRAAPVAVTLACSGFVGRAAASLIPAAALAQALGLDQMPQFVLLGLLPMALTALSMFALSPIMMAVFFGSLFGSLPVMPADPTLIALSISCGWSLSMTVSPFATVVLLTNRVSGIPARKLTLGWNGAFSLIAVIALWPIFWLLTGGH